MNSSNGPRTPFDSETPTEFDLGFLVGVLVGEGHFGGDGRQPQVTLRMHTRHERLFQWLQVKFPGGRLYGPYHHGGRSYYQWMVRGDYLRTDFVPLLASRLEALDEYALGRFRTMCHDYSITIPSSAPIPAGEVPGSI
ncbi:MAG: hypothetical protein M3O87_05290 [Candidatus Dormibacteraeota bacterium]|nr:hypothetical protein [Candidatus Dormibacteraeota bacterium]